MVGGWVVRLETNDCRLKLVWVELGRNRFDWVDESMSRQPLPWLVCLDGGWTHTRRCEARQSKTRTG